MVTPHLDMLVKALSSPENLLYLRMYYLISVEKELQWSPLSHLTSCLSTG